MSLLVPANNPPVVATLLPCREHPLFSTFLAVVHLSSMMNEQHRFSLPTKLQQPLLDGDPGITGRFISLVSNVDRFRVLVGRYWSAMALLLVAFFG